MSLQPSAGLLIEHRPSRRLLLLHGCLFGAAAAAIIVSDIFAALKVVCCAALAFPAAAVVRRHILLSSRDSVVALRCGGAEQWTLHTRDGAGRPARLEAAAFWLFDIILLVFECGDGRRYTVLLANDEAQAEPLRELRAWIRHRLPAA